MTTAARGTTPPSPKPLALMLVASTAAYCIANATWWLQPVLIDQLISTRHLSDSAAGLVVSAEMTAMAVAGAVLAKVQKSGRFLTICLLGALIAIPASFFSLSASSLGSLTLARTAVGVGEGLLLLIANTGMVYFPDPDKAFGKMGTANVVFGVLLVRSLTTFATNDQPVNGFVALFVATCAVAPLMLLMPGAARLQPQSSCNEHTATLALAATSRIALLSSATFIVGLASGVMWSFYAVIGRGSGLSETSVDEAISIAVLSAVIGSGVAALLGNRHGRIGPVTIALALMTLAIAVLSFHPNVWAFRVATCVNVATLYFMMPYFFGAGSAQEPSGRGAAYVSSAFFMTGAVSPYFGGVLFEHVGTQLVGVGVGITSVIAWYMFCYVDRDTPNASPRGTEDSGALPRINSTSQEHS